jgi:alpha-D-xyloside xylohydrolase
MLGPSLLCAPVFSETGTVHYYVPAGSWTNILTREHIMGPAWRTEKHDYFTLPLLARENSILVTGKTDGTPEYDYLDSVTVTVYDLLENTTALADVYSIGGSKTASVSARLENGRITVKTEGLTGVIRLLLANVYGVKSATAGTPEESDWGTMIDFNRQSVEIVL